MILHRLLSAITRQERSKLNENFDRIERSYKGVIDTSNEAKLISNRAENKIDEAIERYDEATGIAEQAEIVANATAQQLDDIIIHSGTSDAEVIALRTDRETGETFNTAGQRMDAQMQQQRERVREISVNVTDFGAVGDGETDNTSAYIAAITYLKDNGGGRLYFPSGLWRGELALGYDLRTAQWVGFDGITVEGAGVDTVLLLHAEDQSAGGELISVRGKNENEKLKNVTLRNFTVRNRENTPNPGNGIGVVRTENVTIENVSAENCTNYGITVETENENIRLVNATAKNNLKSGVALTSSTTKRVSVINLIAERNTEYGLYCTYNNGPGMDELMITNPILRFNGKSGMFGSHFDHSQIIGGIISDNGEEGVYLHATNNAKIIGTTIQRNKLEGVRLSQCISAKLLALSVKDNAELATIKVGVRLHNNTDRAVITGCDIGNTTTTHQVNGMRVDATNTVIDHNTYSNTSSSVVIGTGYIAKIDGVFLDANISGSVPVNHNRRMFYGVAVPTSGTFRRGDIIFNLLPSSGQAVSWVCTADGTPGTWQASAITNVFGTSPPEGIVTANVGAEYIDTTNQKMYKKLVGTGNTGWKEVTLT